jgi:heptosyltransferase III
MAEHAASLIYHAGALGDFITTLPAFLAWRRTHQGDKVVLLGVPSFAPLALPGIFDETWDAGSRLFASLFSTGVPEEALARRLGAVRSALLFASASSPVERHLGALGVTDILRQEPFPSDRTPVVDYHLSLFPGLALAPAERRPRVRVDGAEAPPVSGSTIVLHAGSGSPAKNWPMERFEKIAETLRADGYVTAWVQGPAEDDARAPAGTVRWRGLPLTALAAALARCRLYAGNDSGVTHLAAACGCPTVALFGPSDPHVWAPRGPMVRVIVSGDGRIEGVAENDVLREIRSLLGG